MAIRLHDGQDDGRPKVLVSQRMADDPLITDADLNPPPVSVPGVGLRNVVAVIVLILGLGIAAIALVILVLRLATPLEPAPEPGSAALSDLILALISGLLWAAAGILLWKRRIALTALAAVLALLIGAAAAA